MQLVQLHLIDIVIIIAYLVLSVLIGYWVSHRASRDIKAYFLGGNVMPWYVLGISNASGMFDISGTMLLVYWMFVYGLKSVWIPWLWPTFNQVFLMVYLSTWLRRSNVMTGAEWIQTRFGKGRGAQLAHIIVVIYAFVSIIGFFTYGFKGIGKFAATFLPWHLSAESVRSNADRHHHHLRHQGRHVQRGYHGGAAVLHSFGRVLRGGHHRHDEGRAGHAATLHSRRLGQHLLRLASQHGLVPSGPLGKCARSPRTATGCSDSS